MYRHTTILTVKVLSPLDLNGYVLRVKAEMPRTITATTSWTMRMAMKPLGSSGTCSRPAGRTAEYLPDIIAGWS